MKQFFKMMFASTLGFFVGLMLAGMIAIVFMIGMVAGLGSNSQAVYTPKAENSVFKIAFEGDIRESAEENPFTNLLTGREPDLSLRDLLKSIHHAKEQESVRGIYLDMGVFSGGTASLDAVRRALMDFKESGKFIVAYADNYTQGGYYLASVADKIYLNPQGILGLTGLSSRTMFYKGLLQKIGVEMMVFKVGTYKGAVEPFIADKLSDANREQITSYQNSIWGNITKGIAKCRNITVEDVNRFADEGAFFASPEKAVEYKLIDELKYRSEVEKYLIEQSGQTGDKLKTVGLSNMKNVKKTEREYRNKIAIVYAEGEIMQQIISSPYSGNFPCISEKINDDLRKLADNKDVKAVVLRINSPGGSAYTSEQIWKQVYELKKKKPVVVSMGSVAASGGYYIASGASKIIAEPNTLTGSIGIFGMFPNTAGLFNKLALTTDIVKTNRYADFGDPARPMTDDEKALIQGYIERGYDTFLTRCAEGRGVSKADIDSIGQGRVWTGEQALKIGLVDELGGIERAVELAGELAEIYNYNIMEVSTDHDFLKELLEKQIEIVKQSVVKDMLGDEYEHFRTLRKVKATYGIQARIPYDLKPL
ncbi:signal peptide peptidase SppA [Tannerella forsythia]|uniref:signal peptide peptidase SppA n=1 Tax=Tannerella forsythia TaxID=28112 RepID=UPI00062B05E4|nr:signal peptide peptidase SppA [Tannerella forsythia]KKY61536.1 endopeptidase IV [Tannerella forsythia]TPE18106.1 signal peptide peptidase SppA [Tannerella forsythia]